MLPVRNMTTMRWARKIMIAHTVPTLYPVNGEITHCKFSVEAHAYYKLNKNAGQRSVTLSANSPSDRKNPTVLYLSWLTKMRSPSDCTKTWKYFLFLNVGSAWSCKIICNVFHTAHKICCANSQGFLSVRRSQMWRDHFMEHHWRLEFYLSISHLSHKILILFSFFVCIAPVWILWELFQTQKILVIH